MFLVRSKIRTGPLPPSPLPNIVRIAIHIDIYGRSLRWMSGVTKLDRIRNERIRGTTKVGEISKKVQESRLKWYGHVLRTEEEYVGRGVMVEVPGKRRRGRPKGVG